MEGFTIKAYKLGIFTSAAFLLLSSNELVKAKTNVESYNHLIGLSYEYKGDEVIDLRKLLEKIDIDAGELNPLFDEKLELKIREFQSINNLNVTGNVDMETMHNILMLLEEVDDPFSDSKKAA